MVRHSFYRPLVGTVYISGDLLQLVGQQLRMRQWVREDAVHFCSGERLPCPQQLHYEVLASHELHLPRFTHLTVRDEGIGYCNVQEVQQKGSIAVSSSAVGGVILDELFGQVNTTHVFI